MEDIRVVLTSPEADVVEISVAGEVDMATVAPLREAAERAAGSGAYRLIVFDLEGVTFMDSTGIHLLADTNRSMRRSGGSVEVRCPSRGLAKVFAIVGLDQMLVINNASPRDDVVAA